MNKKKKTQKKNISSTETKSERERILKIETILFSEGTFFLFHFSNTHSKKTKEKKKE